MTADLEGHENLYECGPRLPSGAGLLCSGEAVTLTAEDSKEEMWADVYASQKTDLAPLPQSFPHIVEPDEWTDTSLEGMISCDQEGWMFTSIPYDEGWKIWSTEKSRSGKNLDSFVGIWLSAGSHT